MSLERIHLVELDYIVRLQQTGDFGWLMLRVSDLGPSSLMIGLVGLAYLCIDLRLGARLFIMYCVSSAFTYCAKLAFHSPRPFWMDSRIHAFEPDLGGYGLPSGHALIATSVWLLFASGIGKRWAWVIAFTAVFLVALSRVYLGSHFFSDVATGCVLGTVLILAFLWTERKWSGWLTKASLREILQIGALSSVMIAAVGLAIRSYTMTADDPLRWPNYPGGATSVKSLAFCSGALFGWALGLKMSWQWVRYEPRGSMQRHFLRLAIIAILAVAYWSRPRNSLSHLSDPYSFPIYFFLFAAAAWTFSFVTPWFFVKIGLADEQVNRT